MQRQFSSAQRPQAPQVDARGAPFPEFSATDLPADIVLGRLNGVRPTGEPCAWVALCPAHDDTSPSLSVREAGDLRALVYCHRGCTAADVCAAIDLKLKHLYPNPLALLRAKEAGRRPVAYAPNRGAEMDPDRSLPAHDYGEWDRLALGFELAAGGALGELADALGVSAESLQALGFGWDHDRERWTIPERDHWHRVVGIATRAPDGAKGCLSGSHRGLALPTKLWKRDPDGPVYITEGASDAAALLTVGKCALARPARKMTPDAKAWLAALLKEREPAGRAVVVVADNSECELDGAVELRDHLESKLSTGVLVALPADGSKDVRAMLNSQGMIDFTTDAENN